MNYTDNKLNFEVQIMQDNVQMSIIYWWRDDRARAPTDRLKIKNNGPFSARGKNKLHVNFYKNRILYTVLMLKPIILENYVKKYGIFTNFGKIDLLR